MIKRDVEKKLLDFSKQYPVVTITGPRQSGKTTLSRKVFKDRPYYSLEKINTRNFAQNDPVAFLEQCSETGGVIDEFQRVPELTSYIQAIVDENKKNGRFILTGSQNFNVMDTVSQSLAGRTALVTLLPFSYKEIYGQKSVAVSEVLYRGFYPRIFDHKLNPTEALSFYVSTYLERDVRSLINVRDLSSFELFLKLCAARTGRILNMSNLANECGINHNTAKQWVSVLEASHIIYLLRPHFKNFNKRLVKAPKLYFLDTGLVCFLLEIEQKKQLDVHPLRGDIFETFIVSELIKRRYNQAKNVNLYYFRDNTGNEIDIIIDKGTQQIPLEIKAGQTLRQDMFKNIDFYYRLNKTSLNKGIIVYGGKEKQKRSRYSVLPYYSLNELSPEII